MDAVTQLYTSSSLSSRVAAEVRSQTAKRGLKQVDIANLLNMSQPQISLRLRGKVPFRLDELEALATHFGIDPAELMPRRPDVVHAAGQQPADYTDPQVMTLETFSPDVASGLYLVPATPARGQEITRRTEYQAATRPETPQTFVPVLVRPLTVSA